MTLLSSSSYSGFNVLAACLSVVHQQAPDISLMVLIPQISSPVIADPEKLDAIFVIAPSDMQLVATRHDVQGQARGIEEYA